MPHFSFCSHFSRVSIFFSTEKSFLSDKLSDSVSENLLREYFKENVPFSDRGKKGAKPNVLNLYFHLVYEICLAIDIQMPNNLLRLLVEGAIKLKTLRTALFDIFADGEHGNADG